MIQFIRSLFSRPKTTVIRFEIRAEVGFVKELERLAEASGVSKAEVIDRSVGLYAEALRQAEMGNDIKFIPHNSIIKSKSEENQ